MVTGSTIQPIFRCCSNRSLRVAADYCVGSRFIGAESNTPRWRIFGQHALTLATNVASGVALTDSQNGFRALSRHAIQNLTFKTGGFSVESEMQF